MLQIAVHYGVTYYWDMQHAELIAHYYETMVLLMQKESLEPMMVLVVVLCRLVLLLCWRVGILTIETLMVHGHINAGPIDSDARVMEEEYFIIICQADFETEFNGMPVDVITGLRYETYRCYCSWS